MTKLRLKEMPRYECLREAAQKYPQLDPLGMEAFMTLLNLGDEIERRGAEYFASHGTSQARFLVLILLSGHMPDCGCSRTPAELADMTCCTRATMTGIIDTLERDGMVRRAPSPEDRRMMRVTITDSGRNVLERIMPENFARISRFMGVLDDQEKRTLIQLLGKIRGHLVALEPLGNSQQPKA